MKNLFSLMIISALVSSCGVDNVEPSALLDNVGGGYDTVTPGRQARVEPVSFGVYDQFVNPHPESRKESLYRLYEKADGAFVYQENFAQEISLQGDIEGTEFQLTLYKEKLSTKKIGAASYAEKVDGEFKEVVLSDSEFRQSKVKVEGKSQLEFQLFKDGSLYKSFILSLDEESKELSFYPIGASEGVILKVVKEDNAKLRAAGDYINNIMIKNISCKKITAGNIVSITDYTTLASRSLEYRNCYWDLYEKVIQQFIDAHKEAVASGSRMGQKCIGSSFSDIKKSLLDGKEICKNKYE